uniref:Uncharacterized protein n=1 Tax=Utricularia reniformis TaxID=192314 RepID=A0A1Y0B0W5_9LAMI|nr:hypothetical protein AEK19_MT0783 [Utricularia reniformis]ART31024.1 hypothetical protein AEK19_MT0783 [Utricularia reniformis]
MLRLCVDAWVMHESTQDLGMKKEAQSNNHVETDGAVGR